MRPRRSRGSAADPPATAADVRALVLHWLGQRDLSRAQVLQRLARRGVDPGTAEGVVARLTADGAIDEARLARAAARRETAIKGRGPSRTRARLKALGLDEGTIDTALHAAFEEVDLDTLLERALDKRLRGLPPGRLDPAALRRIVGAMVRQGFPPGAVFARLRRRGAEVDEPE